MKKKKLDPTEAAKKHVNCPCGRCRTPSLPFTPHDLPNFGTGAEGRHLEGRIAATAVALDETEKEFDKVNGVYLVEALDRAEKAEGLVKKLRREKRAQAIQIETLHENVEWFRVKAAGFETELRKAQVKEIERLGAESIKAQTPKTKRRK
jgi:hypothetical protein